MPAFPSVEWFDAIRDIFNKDERYRHFGTVDARIGVRVGDKAYELVFEAFECVSAREISVSQLDECDFYLEQEPEKWREMLENIKANGKADITHTLNTIDLNMPQGLARGNDGYKVDLFYRYNQSLQDFFDASARIDTTFASPVTA
ncbi:MAG TPA: hypothetical protein VNN10_10620 [Dehalococcoidia bacterium]|nr:hypothetical protein [Dehalococcoidia bacterium]